MRTLIAFALTTTLLLGGTTSLRAQPTGLTTNESVIIISIDGNLLDVPTATERDRIVVEIPERTKWRVLRGDYRKGVGDETVVLSFSIPAGHIPTVTRDHERSRLLIGFVRDGALASTQPFPSKAYAIENKRLIPFGFRKHKANRINNICVYTIRNVASFELSC